MVSQHCVKESAIHLSSCCHIDTVPTHALSALQSGVNARASTYPYSVVLGWFYIPVSPRFGSLGKADTNVENVLDTLHT